MREGREQTRISRICTNLCVELVCAINFTNYANHFKLVKISEIRV